MPRRCPDTPGMGAAHKSVSLLPYAGVVAMLIAAISMRHSLVSTGSSADGVARYLDRELSARVAAVLEWEQARRRDVEAVADAPALRAALETQSDPSALEPLLGRLCHDLDGCAVTRTDGTPIASYRGGPVPVELARRAARGRTAQGTLLPTDARGRPSEVGPPAQHVVSFATPVIEGGAIRAILTGRVDSEAELGEILGRHPPGRTGETYAVDQRGFFVTRSRFAPARTAHGLRVVGDALPAAVAHHRSGSDVDGYLDYRGVRVVGAWRWIEELGAAVVTEMDVAEARHARLGP